MGRSVIAIAVIMSMIPHLWACTCPKGLYCTRKGCLFTHASNLARQFKLERYFGCDSECLHNATSTVNCSSVENMVHVCKCGEEYYVVEDSNGTCVSHKSCPPGEGVKTPGTSSADTLCEKCTHGKTFSISNSSKAKCELCSQCVKPKYAITQCSPQRDTVCSDKEASIKDTDNMHPAEENLSNELHSEEKKITTIVISSNVVGVCVIITAATVIVVLYRKRKCRCFSRVDAETILQNEESIDGTESYIADIGPGYTDTFQRLHREIACDSQQSEQQNHTPSDSETSLGERQCSIQYGRQCSDQICSGNDRSVAKCSSSRIPKSRSLPQSLSQVARDTGTLARNTYSFNEPLQLSRLHKGTQGKPIYTFHRALTDLSYHLCGIEWEMFFRRLIGDGCDEILGRVKRDHARSVREQIYHVLLEWKRMMAKEATLEVIIKELEDLNENLLASVYRKKLAYL